MRRYYSFLLVFGFWFGLGLTSGCSGDKTCKTNADCDKGQICSMPSAECIKPECSSSLDCKDNESCVKSSGKCEKRGDEGDACTENGAGCLDNLMCIKKKCTKRCQTQFDCDKGETCDTTTGICVSATADAGTEKMVEEEAGQQIGEDCAVQKCDNTLDCVKFDKNISKCWKPCKLDKDCKDQRICAGGHCVPQAEQCLYDKPGGTLTKPCWSGLQCALDGIIEGKCLRPCNGGDCPAGLKCIEDKGKKFCKKEGNKAGPHEACGKINGKDIGCVSGYECLEKSASSSAKICTKKCQKSDECSWPYFCQGGYCVAGNIGSAKLGDACALINGTPENEICDAKLYCQLASQKDKKGKCYRNCTDPKADACPSGTSCQVITSQLKLCFKTCAKPEDCDKNTQNCVKLQSGAQICMHKSP